MAKLSLKSANLGSATTRLCLLVAYSHQLLGGCHRHAVPDKMWPGADVAWCMQGLNIAPALIATSPVKTVFNPVGPLALTDTLVSATMPAVP